MMSALFLVCNENTKVAKGPPNLHKTSEKREIKHVKR